MKDTETVPLLTGRTNRCSVPQTTHTVLTPSTTEMSQVQNIPLFKTSEDEIPHTTEITHQK